MRRDRQRDNQWARLERKKVAVTLRTGTAFVGVLYALSAEFVELVNAAVVTTESEIPADGLVMIERSNIDYFQVLT